MEQLWKYLNSSEEFESLKACKHAKTEFFPQALSILKKEDSFFSEPRMLFGVNMSDLLETDKENLWKNFHEAMFEVLTTGDIAENASTVFAILKEAWSGKDDEVSKLLEKEDTEDHFKELLRFVMETRVVKLGLKLVDEFKDFDMGDHPDIFNVIKDPEHPLVQKIIAKVKTLVEKKIRQGEITPVQIESDIEAIKSKVMGLFGNVFNEALGTGGPKTGNTPSLLMGNSPEARRQRMINRMQKKLYEKNSR
jgi:hypothetical protein